MRVSTRTIGAAAALLTLVLTASGAAPASSDGTLSARIAAVRASAEQVSHDLGRLEDERAIENLQRSYGFFVDKALWKETADLFADNGTLEIGGRGVFVGKARVLQYLVWLAPQGLTRGKLFNHTQMQPIITVAPDGRTARGRWRFLAEVGDYQKSALWGTGTYENEYVKENGVWKIAKRQGIYDFAYFNFPQGMVEIDRALVKKYPREYAALAYCLEKSGFPVKRVFATKGSDLEKTMKAKSQAWLAA